ncbi:Pentatricopeptide repeat-containing protein 2, mitochondrial [Neolecta irregularis DAH-3]|uniref:Pentatricopeptide repeat-containing protein 2, mitochondrial n=1 Tax=Neolecta irregularis (strain DAH-3) TaxID=1198029 RepID=A0A1U7LVP2_NEOID|nr:Pentatricopeptide repeat-containing protein 2, mitochondrial [Neolecta irregularis DAH-3]|eukprot:OLL26746.1 Pentatricopeptide repeat-containing protein 2, mitochondrial [Neolecta irregularis DAH-3]
MLPLCRFLRLHSTKVRQIPQREAKVPHTSFTLAYETENLLGRNKPEDALELVRRASLATSCTVSWNLLIRDALKRKQLGRAFKYFNEVIRLLLVLLTVKMKKRAHPPNAQTYTILFDGLSNSPNSSSVPEKALALFRSIQLSKSGIQPVVHHANACIKACSHANNIQAVISIFSQMPPEGPQSPNIITYTTYLTALLHTDEIDVESRVREAHTLWATVLKRWSGGYIRADEILLCTLGKVLLIGNRPDDWKFALDLVDVAFGLAHIHPQSKSSTAALTVPNTIEPGNQTLSLILEICHLLRQKPLAMEYWEALQARIDVDLANYERLLRIIIREGSPEESAALLDGIIKRGLEPTAKTIFLALQACHKGHSGSKVAITIWERAKQENITPNVQTYFTLAKIVSHDKNILPRALELFDESWRHLQSLSKTCGEKEFVRLLEFVKICQFALGKLDMNDKQYINLHRVFAEILR